MAGGAGQTLNPWMKALSWVLVTAVVPLAVPFLMAFILYLVTGSTKATEHFWNASEFLLAAIVLCGVVLFDLSEWTHSRPSAFVFGFYKVAMLVMLIITLMFYAAVLQADEARPGSPVHSVVDVVKVGFYGYIALAAFALLVRAHMIYGESYE